MTLRTRSLPQPLRGAWPAVALGLLALGCQSPSLAPPAGAGGAGDHGSAAAAPAPSGAPQAGAQARPQARPQRGRLARAGHPAQANAPAARSGRAATKPAPPFEGTTVAVVLTTNRVGEIEPCG